MKRYLILFTLLFVLGNVIATPTTTLSGCTNPNGWNNTNQTITLSAIPTPTLLNTTSTFTAGNATFGNYYTRKRTADSIVPTENSIDLIQIYKFPNQDFLSSNVIVSIQYDSGGIPNGTDLNRITILKSTWDNIPDNLDYNISIHADVNIGQTYWIVFETSSYSDEEYGYYVLGRATGTTYAYYDSSWHTTGGGIYFKTYKNPIITKTQYQIDLNGTLFDYTNPFTLNIDSNHQIDYNSTDDIPTIESTKTSYCAIDTTAPVTSLTQVNGSTGWNTSSVDFNLSCADSTSQCFNTFYRINSGNWFRTQQIDNFEEGNLDKWSYVINNFMSLNSTNPINGNYDIKLESRETGTSYQAGTAYTTYTALDSNDYHLNFKVKLDADTNKKATTLYLQKTNETTKKAIGVQLGSTTEDSNAFIAVILRNDFGSQSGALTTSNIFQKGVTYTIDLRIKRQTGLGDLNVYDSNGINLYTNEGINILGTRLLTSDYAEFDTMMLRTEAQTSPTVDFNAYGFFDDIFLKDGNFNVSTDGNNLIEYYSTDNAGNNETSRTTYAAVDKTNPTTSFSGCSNGIWNNVNRTINITATDSTSGINTIYLLDSNGTYTTSATTITYVISTDGNHVITYWSKDNATNYDTNKTSSCAMDKTLPLVGQTYTDANTGFKIYGAYITGIGNFWADRNDATSGIANCYYRQNDTNSWINTNTDSNTTHCKKNTYTILDGQTYKFNFRANDYAGNEGDGLPTNTYTGDVLPPVTTFSQTYFSDTNISQIHLVCTDTGSGCSTTKYRIDAGAWQTFTTDFNYSGIGQHTIDYNSTDNIGNQENMNTSNLNMPFILTVKVPIDEETLTPISGKYRLDLSVGSILYFTDLNTDKNIYLPTGTLIRIKVSDNNLTASQYFSRTYDINVPATDNNYTLQPYLVSTTNGLLTTINTINKNNSALPNITFKIYKNITGLGRTLVEQIITDDKGQGLILMVINNAYEFEAYSGATFIKTFNITATSSNIYFVIDLGGTVNIDTNASGFNAKFTLFGTGLIKLNTGTLTLTPTSFNFGLISVTTTSVIRNNGNIIDTQTYTGAYSSHTFTHTLDWADINVGTLTDTVCSTNGLINYPCFSQTYNITNTFGTNYNPIDGLKTGLRSDFGCSPTGWCNVLLILAVIISIALGLYTSVLIGQFNTQATGAVIMGSMIIFTYLTWVPFELTTILVLILVGFILNERRA